MVIRRQSKRERLNLAINIKLKFLILLLFYKFYAPYECQNYKLKIFLNEMLFIFHSFTKFKKLNFSSKKICKLTTDFGKFYVRDISIDWLMASPAFERQDLSRLMTRIESFLKKHTTKKVIFLDIGASIGKFTVVVGNRFKNYHDRIKIFSFEPDRSSFDLLNKNIILNKLKNTKAFNVALSSKKSRQKLYFYEPMQMIVSFPTSEQIVPYTHTLDKMMEKYISLDTMLFVKIDVEGHEVEVLRGMRQSVKKAFCTHIMIEDSAAVTGLRLKSYLLRNFSLDGKVTPGNSFWYK